MPSLTAGRFISEYGSTINYRFADAIQLKTGTELKATFGKVQRYEPWTNADAKILLKYHPVGVWERLHVTLAPRAGVYGRMCTFYGGWAASSMPPPTTVNEMVYLHSYNNVTYGGTGDPGTNEITMPCKFNDTMKDLLKAPDNEGARPIFYYCFTEIAVVDQPPDADRFMLTFDGEYQLYGRY